MMKNLRGFTAGLLMLLLTVTLWSSTGRSQDENNRTAGDSSGRVEKNQSPSTTKAEHLSAEEKLVRDVYARLMRYQSASVDELNTKSSRIGEPNDYLTFELRSLRSGPVTEIYDRPLGELVTTGQGEIVRVQPTYLSGKGDGPHAYYEAEWTTPANAASKSDSVIKDMPGIGDFARYTAYQVIVRLQGKEAAYRAMVLYRMKPDASAKFGAVEIVDNVTTDMNTVFRDEAPRARSPWQKYVKSSLYRAVVRSVKEAKEAGKLFPDEAPIGYLPGDDASPNEADALAMLQTASCVFIIIKKADDSALPSPFRIGITKPGHDRTQHLKAVVSPPNEASNVTISVSKGIKLSNVSAPSNGVITFDVVGDGRESAARGDRTIFANHSSPINNVRQEVSVVVPKKIGTPHDTTGGGMVIGNRVLSASTSPAAVGLPPGQVALCTVYLRFVNVLVLDQFDDPIGDVYLGAEVSEGVAINQTLKADSTYSDPVGFVEINSLVTAGSVAAANWPSQAQLLLQNHGTAVQNIAVQVDGFSLSPAVVNRSVTANPPSNVTISWP